MSFFFDIFNIEFLRNLIVTIIGTFIAVYGSLQIFKTQESSKRREKHFNEIKSKVLFPLLAAMKDDSYMRQLNPPIQRVFIPTLNSIQNIDATLFEDIKNHFTFLVVKWKKLNENYEKYGLLIKQFNEGIKNKININGLTTIFHENIAYLLFSKLRNENILHIDPKMEN